MRWGRQRAALAFLAAAAAGAGCSGAAAEPAAGDAPDVFVAFDSAWQPFRSWAAFHSDGPAPGTVPDDVLGERTQYINRIPPADAKEFPVGTMIVEARANGTFFAAVKRGGNFNITGAKNWEYWEIAESPAGAVSKVWRGFGPPTGDTYGGDVNGCNNCHADCVTNDYICSPKLQLGTFNR
jgi:hypothetical protein